MPKRKFQRKIQNKRKHTVKRNATKIKGLKVEDLIMNPALLQSPQFKALPIEKQFQLTTQLKQYLAFHKPNQTQGVVTTTGGGVSHGIYEQLLSAQQASQRAANEVEAYKVQLQSERQRTAELMELKKKYQQENGEYIKSEEHKREVELLTNKIHDLEDRINNGEIQDLQQQLNTLKEQVRYNDLKRNEEQKAKLQSSINRYMNIPPSSPSEVIQRRVVESNINKNDIINELQSELSYQANAFTTAGDNVNATITNNKLNETLKKSNEIEMNSYLTLDNTDVEAINRVTTLENDNEQQQEMLNKLKQSEELKKNIMKHISQQTAQMQIILKKQMQLLQKIKLWSI